MSIAAVKWAMDQRTDGPSAQSVLFVVADRSNEHGVCRHADPDTIAELTRQSRATVFRRLEELERVGLLVRFTRHLDDGRREYEVRLSTKEFINYKVDKHRNIILYAHSDDKCESAPLKILPCEGASSPEVDAESQIETHPESQDETGQVSPVRLGESHSCDSQKSPSKNPSSKKEDSPPTPPTGGDQAMRDDLEKTIGPFASGYPIPISNLERTLAIWSSMSEAERSDATLGAKGYSDFLRSEEKRGHKRTAKDAHRWLAGRQWLGYLTAGKQAEAKALRFDAREGSEQFSAWMIFYGCCGSSGIPTFLMTGSEGARVANVPCEWPPVGRGLNPDRAKWKPVLEGTGELAAWLRRLRELEGVNIAVRNISISGKDVRGLIVPCQWPPSKSTASGETQ